MDSSRHGSRPGRPSSPTVTPLGVHMVIHGVALHPFALVLLERWRAKHTHIDGQRLMFSGSGLGLFALLIKLCLTCFITFGIYSFWVVPRYQEWKIEHTDFDPTWRPNALG